MSLSLPSGLTRGSDFHAGGWPWAIDRPARPRMTATMARFDGMHLIHISPSQKKGFDLEGHYRCTPASVEPSPRHKDSPNDPQHCDFSGQRPEGRSYTPNTAKFKCSVEFYFRTENLGIVIIRTSSQHPRLIFGIQNPWFEQNSLPADTTIERRHDHFSRESLAGGHAAGVAH